jgi:DNA-binding response OmpR family regulator
LVTGARRRPDTMPAMEAIQDHGRELAVGELHIDLDGGLVVAAGRTLTLSVREYRLLCELARRAGRIVRREELYAAAWGAELREGDRSIDVYIHKLRVKLESALPAEQTYIHTHVGFGYRLDPEPVGAHSHPFHKAATGR